MNWWTIINTIAGIALGAYVMHLRWLVRWQRVEYAAELLREMRDMGVKRSRDENDPLMSASLYGVALGKHYAAKLITRYVCRGHSIDKIADELEAPPEPNVRGQAPSDTPINGAG